MQLGAVSLTLLLLILLPGAVVPTRLCGKKLVDVLKNLCKHQYNTRSSGKTITATSNAILNVISS